MSEEIEQEEDKGISQWSSDQVKSFLTNNNLQSILPKFQDQMLCGYDLCYLTEDKMNKMGISNFSVVNQLKMLIHSEIINQFKVNIIHEGTSLQIQLDALPNLTVENLSKLISSAIGSNESLLLSTEDNTILFPGIDFVDLFLINPDKYKTLKVYNVSPLSNKKNSFQPNKPKIIADIPPLSKNQIQNNDNDNKEALQYKFDKSIMNNILSTTPNSTQGNNNQMIKDKFNLRENDEMQKQRMFNALNSNVSNIPNLKGEISEMLKQPQPQMQIPPQKFEDTNSNNNNILITNSKNYKPQNISSNILDLGGNNLKMGLKEGNDNMNTKMDFQMDYKKFNPKLQTEYKPTKNLGFQNKKFDTTGDNISNPPIMNMNMNYMDIKQNPLTTQLGGVNIKESKDPTEGDNATTNYIFNSNELYNFEQRKKQKTQSSPSLAILNQPNQQIQGISNAKDLNEPLNMNIKFGNYLNSRNTQNEPPQAMNNKEQFKRFSSEKRSFRAVSNPQIQSMVDTNLNPNANVEEYKPKQYQKYSQSPLEEQMDQFTGEKFTRITSRTGNTSSKQIPDDNTGITTREIRGRMGNFNLERQKPQFDKIDSLKQFEKYSNTMDLGGKMDDNIE